MFILVVRNNAVAKKLPSTNLDYSNTLAGGDI